VTSRNQSSKSSMTSSRCCTCTHCHRASASTRNDLHDDDDDDDIGLDGGWTRASRPHPSTSPDVQNHSSTDAGSTVCTHSNRAGCKHSRCYVTSSQVRGGQSCSASGKTRRHHPTVTTNGCSLYGYCSDCQARRRGGNVTKTGSDDRQSQSTSDKTVTATCSTQSDSRSLTTTNDSSSVDDDDSDCHLTTCFCCLPRCLVQSTSPTLTCFDNVCSTGCWLPATLSSQPPPPPPVCCPLLSGQCPLVSRMCCHEKGPARDDCCQQTTSVCSNSHGCGRCVRAKRCRCLAISAPPSPLICCPALADQCRLVEGVCPIQSACPVPRRLSADTCQCRLSHCGQAASRCLESQLTPPMCRPGCCTGLRPSASSSTSARSAAQSNSGRPVCDCCTMAQTGSQSHSVSLSNDVQSTEELQPTPTVCSAACCTRLSPSPLHSTQPRSTSTDDSKSRLAVCPATCCSVMHPGTQSSGPPQLTSVTTQKSASPLQYKVKSADQSKWTLSADKRRISPRIVAAAAGGGTVPARSSSTDQKTTSAKPVITTTNSTATAAATVAAAAGRVKQHQTVRGSRRVDERRGEPSSRAESRLTDTSGLPSTTSTVCRGLPNLASDLANITSSLCARLAEPDRSPRSASLTPCGDELRQLVDAIAGIECDVRAMSTALQSTTTTDTDDSSATKSSSFTVLTDTKQVRQPNVVCHTAAGPDIITGGAGTSRTTAAVALLLPPLELTVTANDTASATQTQTTQVETPYAAAETTAPAGRTCNKPTSTPAQKTIKDTKSHRAANSTRVLVLPTSDDKVGGSKRSDYHKYALVPAATAKLPFSQATSKTAATPQMTRNDVEETVPVAGRLRSAVDKCPVNYATFQTSAGRHGGSQTEPDSSANAKPQFTGIQQIIRQLESISSASASFTVAKPLFTVAAAKPKQHTQAHSGSDHSATAAVTSIGVDSTAPSNTLKNVGTSPVDFFNISTKQTQTSPKSSVQSPLQSAAGRLQDDTNTTIKSRSLESQQQQKLNNPAASIAVTPLALPRSSAAVTTAMHSAAIPLPPPPASPAGTGPEVGMTAPSQEHEPARPGQASSKNNDKSERKRKHS